ncbi:hypothetical protein GUJ93_ZPchr0014g46559 [Zizania palustris]|uniref:RWP-RK domain-containing protein n=1 Tax=Zizania palustris TaxID=103762 RepID=A0A8J5TCU9_ZIZPA|nr:hypothetical protein GUJ93_ZPchr0014g46559 [Zizania palustris]
MDGAAAAVSTLSALAVFASAHDNDGRADAVRSVHGYKVYGRGGRGRWERWVEREFVISPASCREVPGPVAAPRILPSEWRGRPVYRKGQVVGTWRCILAFDSVAAVAPEPTPPPLLSPSGNPRLMCVPSLYNDLEKVFQFRNVEMLPKLVQCNSEEKRTHWAEKKSDEVHASESDEDEDLQSGEEFAPAVQKHRRANRKHIASITLSDIAQYFHLPIREASKTLKIGVSILKRKCRQYNIPRWPHRKIKSLDSLIQDLEQEKNKQTQKEMQDVMAALAKRKRMLETEKEAIQQRPAMDLMAETKQFREDVFKRRYRAKRFAND